MLPQNKRLNLKKDFKWVVSGKRRETANFVIYFKMGDNTEPLIGISLTKKFFKLATQRNLARRIVATFIQDIYPSLPKGLNLIIMPKMGVLTSLRSKLREEIENVTNFS